MKKILHISKFYEPHKGGIEDVCRTVVNIISQHKQEYEQAILCFNDDNTNSEDMVDDVTVHRAAVLAEIASQPISISYYSKLKRLLKEFRPDYIHFHAPNPFVAFLLLLCNIRGAKILVHWHSDVVAQKMIYRLTRPIESKLLRRSNVIIATSPNYIEDSIPLIKHKDKVSILPNVIDNSRFEMTEHIEQQVKLIKERYNGKPLVLFVGRHVPYKGLTFLIEAIKKVKSDAHYLIGGTGPITDKLRQQAEGSPNIHFIGRVSNTDLVSMYYAADIFAFPSITKNEAFGVVLAEAMYCNTPAVTFTIKGSGVNWVNVNDQTGLEVENSDSEAFAAALELLINDEERRVRYGKNARQRVLDLFIKEKIEKQVIDYYLVEP